MIPDKVKSATRSSGETRCDFCRSAGKLPKGILDANEQYCSSGSTAGVLGITVHEINEQIDQPRRVERKDLGKEQRRR